MRFLGACVCAVWNQTFHFNVINENDIQVEVKDEDVGKDDLLGRGVISLANVSAAQVSAASQSLVLAIRKPRPSVNCPLSTALELVCIPTEHGVKDWACVASFDSCRQKAS